MVRLPLLLLAFALVACEAEPSSDAAAPDPIHADAPEAAGTDSETPQVATPTSRVQVNYRGTLPDGTIFDEGDAISFSLLEVVKGFQTNIAGMAEGETKTFVVPPEEGYGDNPPPGVPTNTDMTFEVTLLDVE